MSRQIKAFGSVRNSVKILKMNSCACPTVQAGVESVAEVPV